MFVVTRFRYDVKRRWTYSTRTSFTGNVRTNNNNNNDIDNCFCFSFFLNFSRLTRDTAADNDNFDGRVSQQLVRKNVAAAGTKN